MCRPFPPDPIWEISGLWQIKSEAGPTSWSSPLVLVSRRDALEQDDHALLAQDSDVPDFEYGMGVLDPTKSNVFDADNWPVPDALALPSGALTQHEQHSDATEEHRRRQQAVKV